MPQAMPTPSKTPSLHCSTSHFWTSVWSSDTAKRRHTYERPRPQKTRSHSYLTKISVQAMDMRDHAVQHHGHSNTCRRTPANAATPIHYRYHPSNYLVTLPKHKHPFGSSHTTTSTTSFRFCCLLDAVVTVPHVGCVLTGDSGAICVALALDFSEICRVAPPPDSTALPWDPAAAAVSPLLSRARQGKHPRAARSVDRPRDC